MELAHENGTHRIRVGDDGEVEVQELVPFGKANGEPARLVGVFHPAGEDLTIARATRSHVTAFGIDFAFEGLLRQPRSPGPPDLGGSRTQPPLCGGSPRARSAGVAGRAARACRGGLVGDERPHGRYGVVAGDGPRQPRLLRHGLGRDDGGDDVPSVAPTVLMYDRLREGHRARGKGAAADATALFVTGYLIVWTAAGLAAYGLFELVRAIDPPFLAWDEAGRYVTGGCDRDRGGLPDDAAMKRACLVKCRSPMMFLAERWRHGRSGALDLGLRHGAWCLGCCWALMAALFAVGVMSLGWMALIASHRR